MYVLQLDPSALDAWRFGVSWPGYWSGFGYVERIEDAIPLHTKKAAFSAMLGIFVGLNGCMKIVPLDPMEREYGPAIAGVA